MSAEDHMHPRLLWHMGCILSPHFSSLLSKHVVTHSFTHSARSYWAQSICKAPMLQARPAHDSLSQKSAQAQSPLKPAKSTNFPKHQHQTKKIPYRTESEDKVEVCTCWVPGKTCCLIPCTLAIQPFIKVTSLWCLQIFGTWIRTYILWLITNIHTHCLKKCTELFLWPRWVENPVWLNSWNPPIQSAEASVLKGTGELCWARVDVGNNAQNDRRHHHFVHSVNIFASLPCGSVPCIRI